MFILALEISVQINHYRCLLYWKMLTVSNWYCPWCWLLNGTTVVTSPSQILTDTGMPHSPRSLGLSANQPAVLFSRTKSVLATNYHQSAVLFSHTKSAPATKYQPETQLTECFMQEPSKILLFLNMRSPLLLFCLFHLTSMLRMCLKH